jgi:hypothetical protein
MTRPINGLDTNRALIDGVIDDSRNLISFQIRGRIGLKKII